MQQAVAGQIARVLERLLVEQPRAAHREELQGRQRPHEVGAGILGAGAVGDRQVDLGPRQRRFQRLLVQVQGDLRVTLGEVGQPADQPFLRQLHRHRNPQLRLGTGVAQLVAGLTDQLEGLLQATQQTPRGRRRAHLPPLPLEQRRTELLLELADLVAHRTVGHTQLGRRATEMGVAGGSLEGAQGGERRQAAHG